jgi:rare lipoprotein A
MKKNIFLTAVACIILLSLPEPALSEVTVIPMPGQVPVFSDVDVGNSHYVAIKFLKERNIISGYVDGTFKPENEINRAEALKILLVSIYKAPAKDSHLLTFPDVKAGTWYYDIVEKALKNGIVNGYSDGFFHPEQTIKRAEALKIILLQENRELPVAVAEPPYNDVPVESWFAPYAEVSKERGLILETHDHGNLLPDDTLNRGEYAELIYRLLESENELHFGRATYYADSLAGYGTSSGVPYDPTVFTAANKTLPFGTRLLVTNLANSQSVEVTVNDRGPYATGVELDLSRSAFSAIASPSTGIITTEFKIMSQ